MTWRTHGRMAGRMSCCEVPYSYRPPAPIICNDREEVRVRNEKRPARIEVRTRIITTKSDCQVGIRFQIVSHCAYVVFEVANVRAAHVLMQSCVVAWNALHATQSDARGPAHPRVTSHSP